MHSPEDSDVRKRRHVILGNYPRPSNDCEEPKFKAHGGAGLSVLRFLYEKEKVPGIS